MPFKLCIIGAGSVGFTRKLCSDILSVPEFEGIEIAAGAAVRLGEGDVVFQVESPGRYRAIPVVVEPTRDGLIAVQGLPANAEIVVEGAYFLKAAIELAGSEPPPDEAWIAAVLATQSVAAQRGGNVVAGAETGPWQIAGAWKDPAGRTRTVTGAELADWIGARAGAGRMAPRGFPQDNRFG